MIWDQWTILAVARFLATITAKGFQTPLIFERVDYVDHEWKYRMFEVEVFFAHRSFMLSRIWRKTKQFFIGRRRRIMLLEHVKVLHHNLLVDFCQCPVKIEPHQSRWYSSDTVSCFVIVAPVIVILLFLLSFCLLHWNLDPVLFHDVIKRLRGRYCFSNQLITEYLLRLLFICKREVRRWWRDAYIVLFITWVIITSKLRFSVFPKIWVALAYYVTILIELHFLAIFLISNSKGRLLTSIVSYYRT